jgi:hypothetical protein
VPQRPSTVAVTRRPDNDHHNTAADDDARDPGFDGRSIRPSRRLEATAYVVYDVGSQQWLAEQDADTPIRWAA